MADSLTVRRYRGTDRNAVWAVHDRAFRASPVEFLPEMDRYLRHVDRSFLGAGGEFLVGTLPAEVAGAGEYGPDDERVVACGGFQPRESGAAKVRSVRVDPAFQRRGYASELVAALEDRAREAGFERLVLSTHADLRAACRLYESRGYEVTEREPHPAEGVDGDLLYFATVL